MNKSSKPDRLLAIDALRGIAAFAVVLYHVPADLQKAAGVSGAVGSVFGMGYLGVDAFFVLSGFVISMSVANGNWTFGYLFRFLARRSVRLDPSYWMAMVIEVVLGWIGLTFLSDVYPLPSLGGVVAHIFYLQDFLGVRQISDVFWTLCYEVQFYLLLVGLLSATAVLHRRFNLSQRNCLASVLIGLIVYSLLIRGGIAAKPFRGLMIERSYQFGIGILTYLLASGRITRTPAALAIVAIVVTRLMNGVVVEAGVVGGAACICYLSFKSYRINELANIKPLQFLGKISYSLYLYHASIVGRGATVVLLVLTGPSVALPAMAGLILLVGGSIAVSYLLHRLIELPTMRLSKQIPLDTSWPAFRRQVKPATRSTNS